MVVAAKTYAQCLQAVSLSFHGKPDSQNKGILAPQNLELRNLQCPGVTEMLLLGHHKTTTVGSQAVSQAKTYSFQISEGLSRWGLTWCLRTQH